MQESNTDKTRHVYHQPYQIGFGDAGLQVGQSAFLWSLLAKPKLLYGAEIWTPNSDTKLNELEQIQAQAARKAFGKSATSLVIAEAALGDLGWLSIKSQIMKSKLRFYGYLSRLPERRLARQVFEHRRKAYIQKCTRIHTAKLADNSWFSEVHSALEIAALNPTIATAQFISDNYSKYEWKKLIREKIKEFDEVELSQLMARTDSGIFYSTIKTRYGPGRYVFSHDRKSAMLKFYLRSRSFGLQARIHHGLSNLSAKKCKLCTMMVEENEEHYLLTCPTLALERQTFARTLVLNLRAANYHEELEHIRLAPNYKLVTYLLGGSEPNWNDDAIALIDELMRPFLLQLAAKRKHLMATINRLAPGAAQPQNYP